MYPVAYSVDLFGNAHTKKSKVFATGWEGSTDLLQWDDPKWWYRHGGDNTRHRAVFLRQHGFLVCVEGLCIVRWVSTFLGVCS